MKRKNSTIGCPSVNRGSIGGRIERLYCEGMLEIRYFREKQNKVTMKSSKLQISCQNQQRSQREAGCRYVLQIVSFRATINSL